MRRIVVAGLALGVPLLLAPAAGAEDASVQATAQNTFQPGTATIDVGDTVTWTSSGGVNHTVTSSSGNWSHDAALPVPTRTTSYTFTAPGTYTYYCKTHGTPSSGMRGAVVVRAPSTTRPPTPKPTRTTVPPTPRPSGTPSTSAPPTDDPTPDDTPSSPTPGATTTPPAGSPGATPTRTPTPLPSTGAELEPSPPGPVYLGEGGPGLPEPTGRHRGLPIVLALAAIGGVVSAQLRALLAEPVRR